MTLVANREATANGDRRARDEVKHWSLRQDAVYGRLVGDIRQWETMFRARRQMEKHGNTASESDGTPTHQSLDVKASAISQRLFETLENAGPPQRIETLVVVLGFFANSQQWEMPKESADHTSATDGNGQQTLGGSPFHLYCQRVEALCLALQQQRGVTGGRPPAHLAPPSSPMAVDHSASPRTPTPQPPITASGTGPGAGAAVAAAVTVSPPILATAWSVPLRYIETLRVARLLSDICILATRHLRTLVEQQDVGKGTRSAYVRACIHANRATDAEVMAVQNLPR
jgi:hypothetical protein